MSVLASQIIRACVVGVAVRFVFGMAGSIATWPSAASIVFAAFRCLAQSHHRGDGLMVYPQVGIYSSDACSEELYTCNRRRWSAVVA